MTAVAVLGLLAAALLLPLVVSALRHRGLAVMAVRNLGRRRSEAMLLVGGAMLGTAIITSAFVVGDIVEGSFADAARTELGPLDIIITPAGGTDVQTVRSAVEAADVGAVDGLLAVTSATATIESTEQQLALPRAHVLELDVDAARSFGSDPATTGLVGVDAVGAGEVVLNDRSASSLDAAVGDVLRLHAYGSDVDLTVVEVARELGLAGHGAAIVAPGTLAGLTGTARPGAAPPQQRLLVSLEGGVFDTRERSDVAVASLRTAVDGLPGVEIDPVKAAVLDAAAREGSVFTETFSIIGSFSVLAGILLLVNLFVMLAEERKTELGMLRALGFTRRRLNRAFAIEGAMYAVVAAALGALLGIGIGWLVAVLSGRIFGTAGASGYPLVVEPVSLAIGASTGLVISLVTVWATSLRIVRLNVIRAIRDLPEPPTPRLRRRTLVLAAVGVVVGAGVGLSGYLGADGVALLLGVPVVAFSASPLVRRLLPERLARLAVAGTVLTWGLAGPSLFPDIIGVADEILFVLQGVVLTAGAVSLAGSLDRVWAVAIGRLARGGRGFAARLGVAYPLARRFRTSMLLGMFSLVIFTVTLLGAMSATFERNTDATVDQMASGFDIVLDTNRADPVDAQALLARDDIVAVAGLVNGVAEFGADHLVGTLPWAITGFDDTLLEHGAPRLPRRAPGYASDLDAYRAVLADPTLAIVPDDFLSDGSAVFDVGDTFTVVEPSSGEVRELTVAGTGDADWLRTGALVSRELTATLFGSQAVAARSYVAVADGSDPEAVVAALNVGLLARGAEATTFATLVGDATRELTATLTLLQGFLGLGLLVGTAGLAVVMVRAVRERRHDIGVLRAMGVRTGLVRAALLSEAGLIATQGTLIGAVLGLVTARQLLVHTFGDLQMPFTVPWGGVSLIVILPIAAALAATAWPASRAATIRPAVALRAAD